MQSNNLFGFDEDQGVLLGSDLLVDYTIFGKTGSILKGTEVSSHYFVFDPLRQETIAGWVDFDSEVLGIIKTVGRLNSSDYLASTISVNHFTGNLRGMENQYPDLAWINSSNPNRVNVSIRASSPGDGFRVITGSSSPAVPEPMTMILFGTGLLGAFFSKRKFK